MTNIAQNDDQALSAVSALGLQQADRDIWAAIDAERRRQMHSIELIASENFVSRAVLDTQGSVFTNKYAEGYPGRRYYGGCGNVDVAEEIAIDRAKRLFGAGYANVQPHSGSQANQAVYLALLTPGDKILGLDLKAGGHLTHGAKVNMSGRWFQTLSYGVDPASQRVSMDEVERIARRERPKLIVAGGSAYSRTLDFARFRAIADEVDAVFMADMAHFAGLVAGGVYPSPVPFAHVTTTTTHKTLRGPRGGMILTNDAEIAKKINSAVFPGLQGGPLMHVVAAKAVALGEALQPSFRAYVQAVIENAQALCGRLAQGGLSIVSGGTDCHLGVVDLRPWGLAGNTAELALEQVGITLNKNAVPYDDAKPTVTSGIRVGSAACTSRGMGPDEFEEIGDMILALLGGIRTGAIDRRTEESIRAGVAGLAKRFPLPY
ncbi:serine hydroxymethyltransferase [Achromobacter deleyi]|uniref:serine hydroxymethyltransferase n=1 Tax=Achromobacter deleyi TaxID=1353891 RepID=UPI0014932241|nr:serine hydroxymethyltransferase [Achromobacter deleyi]QVQ26070.1 serine hydroxymethyltransferase [Achromobacter deleyi]UIP21629.1 serine hydroxymethyltransferase [Achromobacter deleyi]